MYYSDLERLCAEAMEGLSLTERQIGEIKNRIEKIGVFDAPELQAILALLHQLALRTQEKFYEKQQLFLSGKEEIEIEVE